jgi:hypothetical protein
MNENFAAVDSALQNRATKSDLSPISTKADTGTVASLSRKVDDLAKSKQNNLGFTPMNKAGDTAIGVVASKVGGYFGQPGGVPLSTNVLLSAYAPKSFANMYMQGMGAGYVARTANGEWSFGTRDDGLGKSAVGSWVINDASEARLWGNKAGTNILTPLNVSGTTAISGGLRLQSTSMLTLSGNESNSISSVYNDNGLLEKQLGLGASIRHAFDFSWYDSHWQIGNVRSGDTPSLGFGITNGNSDIRFLVHSSGATVYGNMVATGTVTAQTKGSSVPDYVFEPGYKLAPLSEVETFTAKHKHLPEVPSAAEIEKGGLDLAQMNLILLKKVEELTLHAIAQQKQIDALTKKVGGL